MKESNLKPSKLWVDKGSKFYNRSVKQFLQNNNIERYSTHNEGKSVVGERFIKTLGRKIHTDMTLILNVYIDKLDDIVNKYYNIYYSTIETCINTCKLKHMY